MKTLPKLSLAAVGGALGIAIAAQAFAAGGERPDFATLDANGDGYITADEISANKNARFSDADANGDGLLDRDELLAFMTSLVYFLAVLLRASAVVDTPTKIANKIATTMRMLERDRMGLPPCTGWILLQ